MPNRQETAFLGGRSLAHVATAGPPTIRQERPQRGTRTPRSGSALPSAPGLDARRCRRSPPTPGSWDEAKCHALALRRVGRRPPPVLGQAKTAISRRRTRGLCPARVGGGFASPHGAWPTMAAPSIITSASRKNPRDRPALQDVSARASGWPQAGPARARRSTTRIDVAAGPDHAHAEQLARHPGERRVDLGISAFSDRPVARVRLGDQCLDPLRGRQMAGRYIRGASPLNLARACSWHAPMSRRGMPPRPRALLFVQPAGSILRPGSAPGRRAPRADAARAPPGAMS
jgi:hypothetical protein